MLGEKSKVLGTVVGFVNDNKNRPIWSKAKEIKVKIIDWSKYIDIIKNSDPELKDLNLSIRSGNGIVFHGFDVENDSNALPILIDNECCGVDAEPKNILDLDKKMISGTYFNGIGVFEKKEVGSYSMFPKFYVDIDFDDVKDCFTGEEKPLYEFMEGRYEYNPRIHTNMVGIVKLVLKQNTEK